MRQQVRLYAQRQVVETLTHGQASTADFVQLETLKIVAMDMCKMHAELRETRSAVLDLQGGLLARRVGGEQGGVQAAVPQGIREIPACLHRVGAAAEVGRAVGSVPSENYFDSSWNGGSGISHSDGSPRSLAKIEQSRSNQSQAVAAQAAMETPAAAAAADAVGTSSHEPRGHCMLRTGQKNEGYHSSDGAVPAMPVQGAYTSARDDREGCAAETCSAGADIRALETGNLGQPCGSKVAWAGTAMAAAGKAEAPQYLGYRQSTLVMDNDKPSGCCAVVAPLFQSPAPPASNFEAFKFPGYSPGGQQPESTAAGPPRTPKISVFCGQLDAEGACSQPEPMIVASSTGPGPVRSGIGLQVVRGLCSQAGTISGSAACMPAAELRGVVVMDLVDPQHNPVSTTAVTA